MNIEEIRGSGLLEQYAMGVLTEQEVQQVEGYLMQFPELQQDYLEIQNALQSLATERSVKPRASLEDELIHSIVGESKSKDNPSDKSNQKTSNNNSIWKLLTVLLALGTIGAVYFYWNANTRYNDQTEEFNKYKLECDSTTSAQKAALDLFNQLNEKENKVFNITPTAGYPGTQLLFHFNPVQKRNYIQIQNLPTIAANQAFQLWSLKPGQDPIPLTVFKSAGEIIVPVDFEEGTGTYAITIEDENGALAPTLERLIGTVAV